MTNEERIIELLESIDRKLDVYKRQVSFLSFLLRSGNLPLFTITS